MSGGSKLWVQGISGRIRCFHGILGPPVVPFYSFFWGGGFPTKINYRKKGTLILTSLLEDYVSPLIQK